MPQTILANGQKTTLDAFCEQVGGWMTKDDRRDAEFELGMYGVYDCRNGQTLTVPVTALGDWNKD